MEIIIGNMLTRETHPQIAKPVQSVSRRTCAPLFNPHRKGLRSISELNSLSSFYSPSLFSLRDSCRTFKVAHATLKPSCEIAAEELRVTSKPIICSDNSLNQLRNQSLYYYLSWVDDDYKIGSMDGHSFQLDLVSTGCTAADTQPR